MIRTKPIGNIKIMKIRISLLKIYLLLIQVSLRPKPLKKTNTTKKIVEKVTKPLKLISLKLQKKTGIKLRTSAILSIIPASRRVNTATNVLKS